LRASFKLDGADDFEALDRFARRNQQKLTVAARPRIEKHGPELGDNFRELDQPSAVAFVDYLDPIRLPGPHDSIPCEN